MADRGGGETLRWAEWLEAQFASHPVIRRPADLERMSGLKGNGRPVIDRSRVSAWLRGERPSFDLTVITARVFGQPEVDALRAAGYDVPGEPLAVPVTVTTTEPDLPSAERIAEVRDKIERSRHLSKRDKARLNRVLDGLDRQRRDSLEAWRDIQLDLNGA